MTKILFTLGWNGSQDRLDFLPTIELIRGIHGHGHEVHLLASDRMPLPEHLEPLRESFTWIRTVKHDLRTSVGFSHNMEQYLRHNDDYEIYHTNGRNAHVNHLTCAAARHLHRPYVITPYGTLNDYRPENGSTIYQKLYRRVFTNHDIRHASCLRAVSFEEGKRFRDMGLDNPIACIPWASPVPEWLDKAVAEGREWKTSHKGRRVGTVLVDLDSAPIEKIIDAFVQVCEPEDELLLMDMSYRNIRARAEAEIARRNLKNVRIIDRTTDYATTVLIASCCVMCIPGHHIYMGPVIARSLLCRTPVIVAHALDWEDLPAMNCGWWCPIGANRLPKVMGEALMMAPEVLCEKGLAGRKLIFEQYSADVVAASMLRLYDWLLGRADKPEFVI